MSKRRRHEGKARAQKQQPRCGHDTTSNHPADCLDKVAVCGVRKGVGDGWHCPVRRRLRRRSWLRSGVRVNMMLAQADLMSRDTTPTHHAQVKCCHGDDARTERVKKVRAPARPDRLLPVQSSQPSSLKATSSFLLSCIDSICGRVAVRVAGLSRP
jgi:hypothetical protein